MKPTKQALLLEALRAHRIPANVATDIVNRTFGLTSGDAAARLRGEQTFANILQTVRAVRRHTIGNRNKWHPDLAVLYERYVSILDSVINDVTACQHMTLRNPDDPDGARIPATPKRIAALAARRNAAVRAKGEPSGPACTASWVTWVSPHLVDELTAEFDLVYARMTGRGRGNRFRPFYTADIKRSAADAVARHRRFIQDQRAAIFVADADANPNTHPNAATTGRVHNRYGALHLCALRMAELALDDYERDVKAKRINIASNPIPVHWTHLLTHDMRQRVRAADADPSSVTPEGLTSFLIT